MNCSTPGLPVHHQLPESTQTHVHRVGDAIQPFHPLSSPSPPAFTLSLHDALPISQSCPTLCDPVDCSTPGFPVRHQLLELAQTLSIESVMPSNHFILCRPLLLLPSIFPSIRVFSNESALPIKWPKYWSFSFSINPSKGLSRVLSNTTVQKHQFFSAQLSL